MNTVSFPGLGIQSFELNPRAFSLPGGHAVYWYGVIMASAFLLGIYYMTVRRKTFGLDADRIIDVAIGGILGGIVGARLYYVVFSWKDYKDNLMDIFKIWNGGLAIYGGIIGGFIVGYLICRARKVRVLPMADAAVSGIVLGQAIGRWGNFMNVEAFGSVTDLPWRMCSPKAADFLYNNGLIGEPVHAQILEGTLGVHPTFFYESMWCLIGFVLLALYARHRRFDGELVLLYGIWYGAERMIVEGLRTDSLMWGQMRVSQVLAALLFVASLAVWLTIRTRIKRAHDPDYLKLYVNTEEGQAVVAGTFYPPKNKKGQTDDQQELNQEQGQDKEQEQAAPEQTDARDEEEQDGGSDH